MNRPNFPRINHQQFEVTEREALPHRHNDFCKHGLLYSGSYYRRPRNYPAMRESKGYTGVNRPFSNTQRGVFLVRNNPEKSNYQIEYPSCNYNTKRSWSHYPRRSNQIPSMYSNNSLNSLEDASLYSFNSQRLTSKGSHYSNRDYVNEDEFLDTLQMDRNTFPHRYDTNVVEAKINKLKQIPELVEDQSMNYNRKRTHIFSNDYVVSQPGSIRALRNYLKQSAANINVEELFDDTFEDTYSWKDEISFQPLDGNSHDSDVYDRLSRILTFQQEQRALYDDNDTYSSWNPTIYLAKLDQTGPFSNRIQLKSAKTCTKDTKKGAHVVVNDTLSQAWYKQVYEERTTKVKGRKYPNGKLKKKKKGAKPPLTESPCKERRVGKYEVNHVGKCKEKYVGKYKEKYVGKYKEKYTDKYKEKHVDKGHTKQKREENCQNKLNQSGKTRRISNRKRRKSVVEKSVIKRIDLAIINLKGDNGLRNIESDEARKMSGPAIEDKINAHYAKAQKFFESIQDDIGLYIYKDDDKIAKQMDVPINVGVAVGARVHGEKKGLQSSGVSNRKGQTL